MYCDVLYCTVLYFIALCCVLWYTVLYCTVLYCTLLCTVGLPGSANAKCFSLDRRRLIEAPLDLSSHGLPSINGNSEVVSDSEYEYKPHLDTAGEILTRFISLLYFCFSICCFLFPYLHYLYLYIWCYVSLYSYIMFVFSLLLLFPLLNF